MNFAKLPEDFVDGIDSSEFRQLMRHQVNGVSIVASGAAGSRVGLTATSVASLSAAPPKILVCVGRANQAHNIVCEKGFFSVNFLSLAHRDLAETFAGQRGIEGDDRFSSSRWLELATGAPILADAIASLDCALMESHTFSTHSIFIGRVVAGRSQGDGDPLVYFRGGYTQLARS